MAQFVTTGPEQYSAIEAKRERRAFPRELSRAPQPTRWGVDDKDKATPFVQERLEVLHAYYSGYPEAYWDHYVAYTEVILLKSGAAGFPHGRDTARMSVRLERDLRFDIVPRLEQHREAAIELFDRLGKLRRDPDTGEIEKNLSARFLDWPAAADEIHIQPADYFTQLATNLTMDWASGLLGTSPGATIRNTIESPVEGRLRPLGRDSRLANTLGVAVMLRTAEGYPVFTVRSQKTAVMSSARPRVHCSASGVFQWKHFPQDGDVAPFSTLMEGMREEIREELNLPDKSYELTPLALARELPRGGKPQLFCSADCELPLKEVVCRMGEARGKWEWVATEDLPEDAPARRMLERPERIPARFCLDDAVTYEGWMAWSLFDAYHNRRTVFDI